MNEPNIPDATGVEAPIVLIGLDERGKPRAARFAAGHVSLATKAAGLMGLTVCPIGPNLLELVKKLPGGRIYANGKGFVPNIRKNLFEKLIEAAGITEASMRQSQPSTAEIQQAEPALNWDEIDVGKLVLAQATPTDGWWEAVVTKCVDDRVTLRWRDYPKDPPIIRERSDLALLNPDP